MFRKRKRNSKFKMIGLILSIVGFLMVLYIIPLKIWYIIISGLFIIIGFALVKMS